MLDTSKESNIPNRVKIDPSMVVLAIHATIVTHEGRYKDKQATLLPHLRYWFAMLSFVRRNNGKNRISRKEFIHLLKEVGINNSRQHKNLLLRQGNGIFWHLTDKMIYFRGQQHVYQKLLDMVLADGKIKLVQLNRVLTPTWIDISDRDGAGGKEGNQQFKAECYRAWIHQSRFDKPVSRATLRFIWDVCLNTLLTWESPELANIEVKKNIARSFYPENNPTIPKHSIIFKKKYSGQTVRFAQWQMPNTYEAVGEVDISATIGQKKKIRRVRNEAINEYLSQPLANDEGVNLEKLYFGSEKGFTRKHKLQFTDHIRYIKRRKGRYDAVLNF